VPKGYIDSGKKFEKNMATAYDFIPLVPITGAQVEKWNLGHHIWWPRFHRIKLNVNLKS
jgi:hypothetical protein